MAGLIDLGMRPSIICLCLLLLDISDNRLQFIDGLQGDLTKPYIWAVLAFRAPMMELLQDAIRKFFCQLQQPTVLGVC